MFLYSDSDFQVVQTINLVFFGWCLAIHARVDFRFFDKHKNAAAISPATV